MNLTRVVLIAGFLGLSGWALPARADHTLTQALFESCDAAKRKVAELEEEGGTDVFDFLVRVLTLSTQAPTAPEVFAAFPAVSREGFGAAPWWQTVDARRELQAKRCALQLLEEGGSRAAHILMSLERVYAEQSLSDEVAVGIEEVGADIAEESHRRGGGPNPEEVAALIEALDGARTLVAENLLHEFFDTALPELTRRLATGTPEAAGRALRIFREADPSGARAFAAVLAMPAMLPSDDIARVLPMLPFPKGGELEPLVESLTVATASAQAPADAALVRLLGRSCSALGELRIPDEAADDLARRIDLLGTEYLPPDQQRCLVESVPALGRAVSRFIMREDGVGTVHAFTLLPAAYPDLSTDERDDLFDRIKKFAFDDDGGLAESAIRALGLFTGHSGETMKIYLQVLRGLKGKETSERSRSVRAAIVDSLDLMRIGEGMNKVAPYLIDWLREGDELEPRIIALLAKFDGSIERDLVRYMKSGTTDERRRVIRALAARSRLDRQTVAALVPLLDDPAFASSIESALADLPPESFTDATRVLGKLTSRSSIGTLTVLRAAGKASLDQQRELAERLAGVSCARLAEQSGTSLALIADDRVPEPSRVNLANAAVACFGVAPLPESTSWAKSLPLALVASSPELERLAADPDARPEIVRAILENLCASPLDDETRSRIVAKFLSNPDDEVKVEVLRSSAASKARSGELTDLLRRLAKRDGGNDTVEAEATLALARLGDTEYDWRGLASRAVLEAGEHPLRPALVELLGTAPRQILVDELKSALASDSVELRVGAMRLAPILGGDALSILPRIWELRDNDNPMIRYTAVLALLEIDPLTPAVNEQVRRLLVNRFYQSARSSRVPWDRTVAVAALDRDAFGTLRRDRLAAMAKP